MTAVPEPTDEALMLAFAGGDATAFERLFERHRRGLFTFLVHTTGERSSAEDLFQEVFAKLVRARDRFRPTGSFRAWLFRIARNAVVDHRRQRGLRGEYVEKADDESSPRESVDVRLDADPVARSSAVELRGRIEAALGTVSDEQREVFVLRERSGLSFEEIAELTGANVATVKSRMRYALAHLRRALEGERDRLAEPAHE